MLKRYYAGELPASRTARVPQRDSGSFATPPELQEHRCENRGENDRD
jgi:hypothetical protein